jgi:hypothetical protein
MGANSLPYARFAIASLFENSLEALDLTFVTDEEADRTDILKALGELPAHPRHTTAVRIKSEIDELARVQFAGLPHLSKFRDGHPCWRKITDPLLLAQPGEEMVILDPDLYFPNRFRFETTPAKGILLMWQPPSCLLPDDTVMNAYRQGIALAHHVDIGVAHARKNLDLAWLDGVIAKLADGKPLPRAMHVEAIVWAAIAMKEGGGYLNPDFWHCWRNSQWKRAALKLKLPGQSLLGVEQFADMKCFHGGGPAKWWIPGFVKSRRMPQPRELPAQASYPAFDELTVEQYESTQRVKRLARKLGYYKLF